MRRYALLLVLPLGVLSCSGDTTVDESTVIRGHVFDVETMEDLADVKITSMPRLAMATSDANGAFELTDARFATLYLLRVEREGYVTATVNVTPSVRDEEAIEVPLALVKICEPGVTRCLAGGGLEGVETCGARGGAWALSACATDEVCDPSSTRCSAAYPLTVQSPSGGVVRSQPAGILCGVSCERSYVAGTSVTLTASPLGAGSFSGWTGDCAASGVTPTCTITMDQARNVGATFADFSLTVQKNGAGVVTSEPAGIDCGDTCTSTFDEGTSVTLTAVATAPAVFESWGGDCAGTAPTCAVTIDGTKSAVARFAVPTFPLDVTRAGTGAGIVTSSPAGIDCGADCAEDFPIDTMVTLTAEPANGSTFEGFGGACAGATCTVTMDQARSVVATFDGVAHPLTVTTGGTGTGVISSSPSGIDCGATCTATYGPGTVVTLTAMTSPTSVFAGWTGDCAAAGTTTICDVTMDMPRSVGADFDLVAVPFAVTVTGPGRVTSSPAGIDCPGDCDEPFNPGTMVTLTATPDPSSGLGGWFDACAGAGNGPTCVVTVGAGVTATADFRPLYALPLAADAMCTALYHFDGAQPYTSVCGGGGPAMVVGTYTPAASRNSFLVDALDAGGASEEAWIDTVAPGPVPPNATVELTLRKDGAAFDARPRAVVYTDFDTTDPTRRGFSLVVANNGMLIAQTRNAAGQTTTASSAVGRIVDGVWYHVAATMSDTNGLALFVDGAEVTRVAGAPSWTASSSTAWVGAAREGSGAIHRFNGAVDEVRVSNGVRY